jgi:hypothetical protein
MPRLVFASHGATQAPERLRPGSPKRHAGHQSRPTIFIEKYIIFLAREKRQILLNYKNFYAYIQPQFCLFSVAQNIVAFYRNFAKIHRA